MMGVDHYMRVEKVRKAEERLIHVTRDAYAEVKAALDAVGMKPGTIITHPSTEGIFKITRISYGQVPNEPYIYVYGFKRLASTGEWGNHSHSIGFARDAIILEVPPEIIST